MANKLSLNAKKSNFDIFRTSQKGIDYDVNIIIYDSLERKECVRYLGVLTASKISWTHHITYIPTKNSKSLGILARLKHFVPSSTLLSIYRSLVQPYLSYGIVVWGQAAPTNLEIILILQKRALRLIHIFISNPLDSTLYLCSKLSNVIPLDFLSFKTICLIMHNVFNNVTPPNFSNLFTYSSKVHHHNTRFSAAGNFYIKHSRTDHMKNSFSRIGAEI